MISQPHDTVDVDVVIVGGGPAGSTASTLLRRYNPELSVLVLEKEKFPREHVGESQLPGISRILDEMGVWDKVEAAGFPIKIGGSYTWGRNNDVWDFDFYPAEEFIDEPRPARFKGQREHTAFQVERAIYDDILLRHAESEGTQVREQVMVREVMTEGDRITGLRLDDGTTVRARHYVDATGHVGLFRKALDIGSMAPKELRNVAFWDYWDNAEWAIKIGVGATRVQVRSLPYGWIWFIPLGPSRASVGLICPSDYYKDRGLSPKELYAAAIAEQPEVRHLLRDAHSTSGGEVLTTKNWSQLTDRLAGENWFICGEAAGFADPILAAGMTLAHNSARETAYCILQLEREGDRAEWVKNWYDEKNRRNIDQHIRFAKYWYAANGCFTDLQDHCADIAKESGLRLTPQQAWRWLAQGGFANQNVHTAGFGAFDLGSAKSLVERFSGGTSKFAISQYNEFELNLRAAEEIDIGEPHEGVIQRVRCYRRGEAILPQAGDWKNLIAILKTEKDLKNICDRVSQAVVGAAPGAKNAILFRHIQALEAMLSDGWVMGRVNRKRPTMRFEVGGRLIRSAKEARKAAENAKAEIVFNTPEPVADGV
jgi:flavin-dependent dehydrogenase